MLLFYVVDFDSNDSTVASFCKFTYTLTLASVVVVVAKVIMKTVPLIN